jgi:ATP-dependent DNA helicase RecG
MVINFLKRYKQATRNEIEKLLMEKLPQILDHKQKVKKISNILSEMSKKDESIENKSSKRQPRWVLRGYV